VKVSSKAQYAVMAICDLASHASERPVSIAEIAKRQGVSVSYLEQMFARMRGDKLVRSVRGPGGGYLLVRPAEDILVSDIVRSVGGPFKGALAKSQGPGSMADLTAPLWTAVQGQVLTYLDTVTVGDILAGRIVNNGAVGWAAAMEELRRAV
jgi:Rrf2 family iron-sulfur cluster assembly transcriptional regulator